MHADAWLDRVSNYNVISSSECQVACKCLFYVEKRKTLLLNFFCSMEQACDRVSTLPLTFSLS